MNLQEQKKQIRQQIKSLKNQVSKEEASLESIKIGEQLESLQLFIHAEHILMYWSLPDEVETHQILNKWYKTKHLYLPAVMGNNLQIRRYSGEASLIPGERYGISEPTGDILNNESIIDLVVIPGVAFDKKGNRMGRGAGYYDRILKRLPQANKIGLAYSFQMQESIPTEAHDIAMDVVICP
jgi:5-formyltetrahydrofolate cyclo-ligase